MTRFASANTSDQCTRKATGVGTNLSIFSGSLPSNPWMCRFIFYWFSEGGREGRRERKRDREREVRKRHPLVASHRHLYWTEPETWVCALIGTEPATFRCMEMELLSNQLSHTSKGWNNYFLHCQLCWFYLCG